MEQSKLKTKVFISYSRKDMAFVDRLAAGLKSHKITPTIDRTEIYAFEAWWKRIQTLIAEADTIVFVLSPDAVSSDICRQEVEHARTLNKRFAPIVCRSLVNNMTEIPPALADLNFVSFEKADGFEIALDALVNALATDIDWIRLHTEYGLDAIEWEKANRPHGLLLRSPRLEQAERWIATRPAQAQAPTSATQALIFSSRRGASRRRNLLTASLGAGFATATILSGIAFYQRGEAIKERTEAEEQRRIAEEQTRRANSQRLIAEQNFDTAKATVDHLIFDIAQGLTGC